MKILQIIYNLSSGGAERFVVDLCNELSKFGKDEIHLLTTDSDDIPRNRHYLDTLSPKVHYHNIGAKSGFSLKSIWGVYKAIKEIKEENEDLIITREIRFDDLSSNLKDKKTLEDLKKIKENLFPL